jgi:thioredoxin reductase (NADPH)
MDFPDIAIVGAGPAGLSAALYAARFRRRTLVLHDGKSRASHIPLTHNVPGFENGVAGQDLLHRMHRHAARYGAIFEQAEISDLAAEGDGFELAAADGRRWRAGAVILATGIRLNQVDMDARTHQAAIDAGRLRYCPVCDGYEHIGRKIAVLGCDRSGVAEALFLTDFSPDISILTRQQAELTTDERAQLAAAGIAVITEPVAEYILRDDGIVVRLESGQFARFDVLYGALGSVPRNRLAVAAGISVDADGVTPADSPLGTNVPGLFCAGDVVAGLDQISVAIGHGAMAATRAHNWLRTDAFASSRA